MRYTIACYAREEIEVEADSEEEAEQIAVEQCIFPYVDYCEIVDELDEE